MYSESDKRTILNKIINSDVLKSKDIYHRLLEYIVESSLKDTIPTEVSISQDVFHKGEDFISAEDTTVRVYMHNLRKKLDQYYQKEGKHDEIRLLIPKGHYRVEFEKNTPDEHEQKDNNRKWTMFILSLLLTVAIGYILFDKLYYQPDRTIKTNPYGNKFVWDKFFDNGFECGLLVGDFLVFHEYNRSLGRARRIQDYMINTDDELKAYVSDNREKEIEKWTLG